MGEIFRDVASDETEGRFLTTGALKENDSLAREAEFARLLRTLDQVALRLNQRPRKTAGFQTPGSELQASVASTSSACRGSIGLGWSLTYVLGGR